MSTLEAVARYRWVILALAVLGQWSASLAAQALAPLAPLFQPELGLTKAEVGLFSSATFLGAWFALFPAGSFTDRFGIKVVMAFGQLTSGLLLLTIPMMGHVFQAAAVMFLVGLGRGIVFPGTTKAVLEWFPPASRATAMGVKQTGSPIAGIAAASTLPAIGLVLGWRAALVVAGVSIIAAGVAVVALYRNPSGTSRSSERRPGVLAGLRAAIALRRLWLLSSIAVLLVMVQLSVVTYLALYFNDVVLVPIVSDERTRIIAAGGYLALCQAGGVFGRVFWGFVSDRLFHGRRAVVIAMVGILTALLSVAMSWAGTGFPLWLLVGVTFTYGACAVGWNGVYHAMITETIGRKYAASGVGLSMMLVESGTVVAPPIFGFVVDVTGSYSPSWVLLAGVAVAGSLIAVLAARGEAAARVLKVG